MLIYKWFKTSTQSEADRCAALVNQAHGSTLVEVKTGQNPSLYFGEFGVSVDRGSEAGDNAGAVAVGDVHDAVVANTNSNVNASERLELIAFFDVAVEISHDWHEAPYVSPW